MGVSPADNSVNILQNLLISNPKPDLHNINAHTKFGENPLIFTQFYTQKTNLANSNPKPDLHNVNAHIKFGGNPLIFTQVIVRKQKYGQTTNVKP